MGRVLVRVNATIAGIGPFGSRWWCDRTARLTALVRSGQVTIEQEQPDVDEVVSGDGPSDDERSGDSGAPNGAVGAGGSSGGELDDPDDDAREDPMPG